MWIRQHIYGPDAEEEERHRKAKDAEIYRIKATLLDNGSLTLTYDHKVMKGEKPQDFVPHIINALGFASNYIIEKIGE